MHVYQEMLNMGFEKRDCNMVAASVSEISTNAIRYAGSGVLFINETQNKRGIEIIIKDEGPGIADIDKALKDGFTTLEHYSFGVGLGAAKRAMDYFDIKSKPGEGTEVVMRKFLKNINKKITYGSVSLPDDFREVNGDELFVKEFEGDKVLMSVVDGLGEGAKARRSASIVKETLNANFSDPLDELIEKCDKKIKALNERGVTIGILLLKPDGIEYTGVGDTFIHIYPKITANFFSRPGILGTHAVPNIRISKAPLPNEEFVIVMCTDGIHDHFEEGDIALNNNPRDIAESIMRDYRRKYGDATVLVAKITP